MNPLSRISPLLRWIAAILLVALPAIAATDYGGILRWTHFAVAVIAFVAVALAALGTIGTDSLGKTARFALVIPVLLWLAFSVFQIVPLPAEVVDLLSPSSAEAYTSWLTPYLPAGEQLTAFPISIAKHDSKHACYVLCVLIAITWAASAIFHDRPKTVLVLCGISIGVSAHAAAGLWCAAFPDSQLWTAVSGSSFGGFVNRNNAALMLNLGLGCSLGLLAWRLTALSGQEIDDPTFELNDLLSLTGDRDSFVGLLGCVLSVAGLLVCGSRGGLVAACFGLLLAFGWIRQRRGLVSIPVVGAVIGLSLAFLLVPLRLNLETIARFDVFASQDSSTVLSDGRLQHWLDGLQAAKAHLPMGSGLSTYAYAYLPHQEHTAEAWAHHADNLWLELLVEQGIFGILLAACVTLIVVFALRRLGDSPDPIDHGLRVAGWYCLGAVFVSQFFDFGLILLGNMLVVAILLPTIVARASCVVVDDPARVSQTPGRGLRLANVVLPIVSVALVGVSIQPLNHAAKVDALSREVSIILARPELHPQALDEYATQLKEVGGQSPSPEILNSLARVEYRRARLQEVLDSRPTSESEARERYLETGPAQKRLVWLMETAESPQRSVIRMKSDSLYERPLQASQQCLVANPLSLDARAMILYLDFVHQDLNVTKVALNHLKQLHRNRPKTVIKVGQYAADAAQFALAADLWRSVLIEHPGLTRQVLAVSQKYGDVALSDVIPDTPSNLRAAAPLLLTQPVHDVDLMAQAHEGLDCEHCSTRAERAACEEVAGDIADALTDQEAAVAHYREAILLDPINSNTRVKLISQLREAGESDAALREARKARLTFPDDERFQRLIDAMAAADLDRINKLRETGQQ